MLLLLLAGALAASDPVPAPDPRPGPFDSVDDFLASVGKPVKTL